MHKKGIEISPPSLIVTIVIALVVLAVLLFIFNGQFSHFFSWISGQKENIIGNRCENPIFGRTCAECPEGYMSEPAAHPRGENWDCDTCKKCIKRE